MRYEERNGLRILTSDFGYLLYNKENDIYSEKVYLGKFASVDDYEEVIDEAIDKKMLYKLNQIDNKIDSLEQNTELVYMLNEIINE